jgi:ATP-dependent DNA ligase
MASTSAPNGDDLRLRPLEARREELHRLVDGVNGILFSEALAGRGRGRVRQSPRVRPRRHRVEAGSFYKSGRSRNWLKTVNSDFVRT